MNFLKEGSLDGAQLYLMHTSDISHRVKQLVALC